MPGTLFTNKASYNQNKAAIASELALEIPKHNLAFWFSPGDNWFPPGDSSLSPKEKLVSPGDNLLPPGDNWPVPLFLMGKFIQKYLRSLIMKVC